MLGPTYNCARHLTIAITYTDCHTFNGPALHSAQLHSPGFYLDSLDLHCCNVEPCILLVMLICSDSGSSPQHAGMTLLMTVPVVVLLGSVSSSVDLTPDSVAAVWRVGPASAGAPGPLGFFQLLVSPLHGALQALCGLCYSFLAPATTAAVHSRWLMCICQRCLA